MTVKKVLINKLLKKSVCYGLCYYFPYLTPIVYIYNLIN